MKILRENVRMSDNEGGFHMVNRHRDPERHIPPHERKALINVEFDKKDWELLKDIFGDEDTAAAAAQIVKEAPPEIQILAIQLINMIEEAV